MNRLRKLLCIVLAVSFVVLPPSGMHFAFASAINLDATDVEAFLDTVIRQQMEEHNIPNLTASVVVDGEIIFAKGYGYANYETGKPVDPERTLFRIGSSAKLFTWTAIMQLAEQGKVDLDTDVNEYLDFEIPNHLEYKGRKDDVEPITIRHLMNHTPGFEDYMSEVFSISEDSLIPLAQHVRDNRPARVFVPGEVSAYSNYGTALAGYIVELISGVPYAQYIEENIYRPLNMKNSTFRQPIPDELTENMSKPYRYLNGEFVEGKFEFMTEPSGSMSSSAVDMAKFMLAYLQGGQYTDASILMPETVHKMFSEQFTHHPQLDGMAHGFIKATFNGRETFHHPGGTMLYDTGLYLIPDKNIGFFISHSGGNVPINIEIFQGFLKRYLSAEAPAILEPPVGMEERSRAFVGEYYQNRRSFTNVDAFLSLMFGRILVETDENGYLLVANSGETHRFVEIESGVYSNLQGSSSFGDFRTIAFGIDSLGKTMLMTDGPMSYSKAAWYETSGLNLLMLIAAVLFIIASLLYWVIRSIINKIRRGKTQNAEAEAEAEAGAHEGAKWAKRVAVLLGVLTLIFMLGFLVEGEIDPVYGLPAQAYTPVSTFTLMLDLIVSYAIVITTLGVLVFSVISWIKGYWKLAGRIHYTLFALFALVLSWIFYFWNAIL
ncbi:serine hydrolase domain-containing protein [Desulfuribacillus alkaliarsenatis]|uniref:Serine hydrolase n=1 Tax=Desulfuribacillus alkaliarsenatis TaxID=766136 RepID=A0A1E5G260_9FIRM|nr:serine hydrolase domain-containing protein [Desulfuribacillus alkaliarsenatis]OEF97065.1 serine hydrolase [Desulfuribacillus alkaliarsenatis]